MILGFGGELLRTHTVLLPAGVQKSDSTDIGSTGFAGVSHACKFLMHVLLYAGAQRSELQLYRVYKVYR